MIERTPEPESEPNISLAPEIQAASTPQVDPEIELKSDPEAFNEPKAEPPSPGMSFRGEVDMTSPIKGYS